MSPMGPSGEYAWNDPTYISKSFVDTKILYSYTSSKSIVDF